MTRGDKVSIQTRDGNTGGLSGLGKESTDPN